VRRVKSNLNIESGVIVNKMNGLWLPFSNAAPASSLSEDLNAGQMFAGARIENPFFA
jgi:hypothetical protein